MKYFFVFYFNLFILFFILFLFKFLKNSNFIYTVALLDTLAME